MLEAQMNETKGRRHRNTEWHVSASCISAFASKGVPKVDPCLAVIEVWLVSGGRVEKLGPQGAALGVPRQRICAT